MIDCCGSIRECRYPYPLALPRTWWVPRKLWYDYERFAYAQIRAAAVSRFGEGPPANKWEQKFYAAH